MVTSGLSVRTDVSHIRLAVHLVTALVILSGIVWTALDLRALHASPLARPARLRPIAAIALLLLLGQLIYGAFTAWLGAGYAFASLPLMGHSLFPAGRPRSEERSVGQACVSTLTSRVSRTHIKTNTF